MNDEWIVRISFVNAQYDTGYRSSEGEQAKVYEQKWTRVFSTVKTSALICAHFLSDALVLL